MNLAVSEEAREFGAVLHKLLDAAEVGAVADAWSGGDPAPGRKLWRRLAEVGVTGLAGDPAVLIVVCEELGHHAVPGPVAESLAAVPVLLPSRESLIATMAAPPWLPYAVDADFADLVLVVEPGAVRRGIAGAPVRSVDPTRRLCPVEPGPVLAAGPDVDAAVARAIDLGVLACAAQLLGAGHAVLEIAADHARMRTQFGRPIGQFQAVSHRLAGVAVALEFARPLLYAAAVAVAAGSPTAARDVSAAKVACGRAAEGSARAALQVHGAIGYTQEYRLARWLTKVRALTHSWGSASVHRARVMAALSAGLR